MTATAGSLPKDNNFVSAIGAVSSVSDTGASLLPLQYNPSTRGLTVHIVGDDVGIGGSGGLTDAELRASAVPVSLASVPSHAVTNAGTFAVQATLAAETTKVIGTVNVSAGQTIGVTGTFWQATQPVSLASLPSLAAGTNAIGKLAANSGVDIGDVDVTSLPAYTTPASGELAGATSATQMPNVACKLAKFKAAYDNAGRVYIGGSSVTKKDGTTDTTTGIELSAGEETGWLPVSNINVFYRICDNAGDDLTYLTLA